jgi:uncharacterized delta-60 repeat protein
MKNLKIKTTPLLLFFICFTQTIKSAMALDQSFSAMGLDQSFGDNGSITLPPLKTVKKIALQPNNKIIVLGSYMRNNYLSCYNQDGSFDETFGNNGTILLNQSFRSIILQPHGNKIIVSNYNTIIQYNQDGTLDTNFGNDGIISPTSSSSIALSKELHNSKIIALGTPDDLDRSALTRFNINGSPDRTFGPHHTGRIDTSFKDLSGVFVQPRTHKIITSRGITVGETDRSSILLLCYNPDGSIDRTFGPHENGATITSNIESFVRYFSFLLQPDNNKIITYGSVKKNDINISFIARYNQDGTADVTFGPDGTGVIYLNFYILPSSIIVSDDDKIIVCGYDDLSQNILTRYHSNGLLDTTFSPDGTGIIRNDFPGHPDFIAPQENGLAFIVGSHNQSTYYLSRYKLLSAQEIEEKRLIAFAAATEAERIALAAATEAEIKLLMDTLLMDQCNICLESGSIKDLGETPCKHVFHPSCFARWRTSGNAAAHKCPVCRAVIPNDLLKKL